MSSQISTFNNNDTSLVDKGNPSVISIDKAIIMSDLHLGYEKSNVTEFMDFLKECISNGI